MKYQSRIPTEAEKVFEGVIYDVYQWQQKMYDGTFATFEMLKRTPTVLILVIDDNRLLVQRQSQPTRDEYWSIPSGRVEKDEEPLSAAKRELAEETGIVCDNWRLLDTQQDHPKIEHEVFLFIANNVTKRGEQNLDNGEKIVNSWVELDKFTELLKNGEYPFDSMLCRLFLNEFQSVNGILDFSYGS